MSNSIQECQRCGTCCRKGPPALHIQDKELYLSGVLDKMHLITLRKGEYVFDNIQNRIEQLPEEMIRLKTREGASPCLFLDESTNNCNIYSDRPAECRAMKCWDTEGIINTYAGYRLKRKDLISADSALWEIILEHENSCSVQDLQEWVQEFKNEEREEALTQLSGIIDTDLRIRNFLQERTGADTASMEFVLGRPLDKLLPGLGLRVEFTEGKYRFQKIGV